MRQTTYDEYVDIIISKVREGLEKNWLKSAIKSDVEDTLRDFYDCTRNDVYSELREHLDDYPELQDILN